VDGIIGDHMRVYPKVPGLAAWSENCKWYSFLPLDSIISLFYKLTVVSVASITLCAASQRAFIFVYFTMTQSGNFGYTLVIVGFRRNRSTTDGIFCIRKILEKNGSVMGQCISYLQISRRLMTQ
jgi:hypothetical protein